MRSRLTNPQIIDTSAFEKTNSDSQFVEVIEKRTGYSIGCIEEVAWRYGVITDE